MVCRSREFLITVGLMIFVPIAWGQGSNAPVMPKAAHPAQKKTAPIASKPVTVNDLAAKPDAHLGHVSLIGVVASINKGKGFLLIDNAEYKACGLSCLTEAGTKKVPVRWTGAPPKVEGLVRIDGTLTKAAKGFTLAAERVGKP